MASQTRRHALVPVLAVLLVAAALVSIGIGAVSISPSQVAAILYERAGGDSGVAFTGQQEAVLWSIRLPRVVMAILVGGALAAAGVVLQTMLRNPLADPGLVGLSSGASLGVIVAAAAGVSWLGEGTSVIAGVAAAMIAGMGAVQFARLRGGRSDTSTIIVVGIAITLLTGSATMLMTFLFPDAGGMSRETLAFGSLGSSTWELAGAVAPAVALGLALAIAMDRELGLFELGETSMLALGVKVEKVRLLLMLATALMVGAAVAGAGVVGFVGLIIPQALRMIAGPGRRSLLIASALAGGAFLVLCDLAARTLVAPVEIPVGVVTSLAGAPFLLLLVLRQSPGRRRAG